MKTVIKIAKVMINPPMIVLADGDSLIPINIQKNSYQCYFILKFQWLKSLKSFSQIICYFSVTGKSYVFCDRELLA